MPAPRRIAGLLLICLGAALLVSACAAGGATAARRDAQTFVLEVLRKQQGEGWQQLGQYMLWSYRFDPSGCVLQAEREAELGDHFQQRIPLAAVTTTLGRDSEVLFSCRDGSACIDHRLQSRAIIDQDAVSRTRLLVMDPQDRQPLLNALAELQRLCHDPYAPAPPQGF